MKTSLFLKKHPAIGNVAGALCGMLVLLFFFIGLHAASTWLVRRQRHKALHRGEAREYRIIGDGVGVATKAGDGTVRTVDLYTRTPRTPWLRWIANRSEGRDSLIVFCDPAGRRGFINANDGRIAIKARWAHAWNFSEGLAAVTTEGGRIGFIDPSGGYAIPPSFHYWSGMDYLFRNGHCPVTDEDGRVGVIDHEGQWVIPPSLDRIGTRASGAWVVWKDGRAGLLDPSMRWLYEPVYERIVIIDDRERLVLVTEDGVKQLRTYDGKVLSPFVCDYAHPLYRAGPDGCEESDLMLFATDGRLGLLDPRSGEIILPSRYADIDYASETDGRTLVYCTLFDDNSDGVLFDYVKRQFIP